MPRILDCGRQNPSYQCLVQPHRQCDQVFPANPELQIRTANSGRLAAGFRFRQKGIGIDKEYQKQVFDTFFRVPTGDVHDVKGFGLGLAYVKKSWSCTAERSNCGSERGNGTTFTLTLPNGYGMRPRDVAGRRRPEPGRAVGGLPGKRKVFDVKLCKDGELALRRSKPRLTCACWTMMPKLDGFPWQGHPHEGQTDSHPVHYRQIVKGRQTERLRQVPTIT